MADFEVVKSKRSYGKQNKKIIDENYLKWIKDGGWKLSFNTYADRSMSLFELKCPKEIYETDEDYRNKCDKVYQNLKKKSGSCDLPMEECFAQAYEAGSDRHFKCEENRSKAYEIFLSRIPPDQKPKALVPQFNTCDFPEMQASTNETTKFIKKPMKKEEKWQSPTVLASNEKPPIAATIKPTKTTDVAKFKASKKSVFYDEASQQRPKIEKISKKKTKEDEELDTLCQSIEAIGKKKTSTEEKK